jgi:hypothetical protein
MNDGSLKAVCPWCGALLYETLGEEENLCQAECRTEGCKGSECGFTVQIGRKRDRIIFIEDDGDFEEMVYSIHSGGWHRDKPEIVHQYTPKERKMDRGFGRQLVFGEDAGGDRP